MRYDKKYRKRIKIVSFQKIVLDKVLYREKRFLCNIFLVSSVHYFQLILMRYESYHMMKSTEKELKLFHFRKFELIMSFINWFP